MHAALISLPGWGVGEEGEGGKSRSGLFSLPWGMGKGKEGNPVPVCFRCQGGGEGEGGKSCSGPDPTEPP